MHSLLPIQVEPKYSVINDSLSHQLLEEWSDTACCNGWPCHANYTIIQFCITWE